ncbi:sorting nexin-13-like isoform X2 [Saccostrea echinata]|uniref:sorting nexin-13-like isoform X2 n=1 Tax=Saccostrea echinata TaxID=191078 RepID=UPI002A806E36|nr:sorting nexin-13-like isoform X2 [Saccostrea echinata]
MLSLEEGWKWPALALFLFLVTFGSVGILSLGYIICIMMGGLVMTLYYGRQLSLSSLTTELPDLTRSRPGILNVVNKMESSPRGKNFDRRMTGASVIDEALHEVLTYAIKDYIKSWYRQVSDHDGFVLDIRQCVQKLTITFASRTKDVDWMPFFSQRLVDDFASHLRLYRRAREQASVPQTDDTYEEQVVSAFFDLELAMEKDKCRDLVCLDPEAEKQYLQNLSEVLLFLLLPPDDFQNKTFRYILREVLVNGIFLPTIELLSDPDYINQLVAWLCKDGSFTNETFLNVIKTSHLMDELEAVKEITEQNIAKWRSKDTGGADDAEIKQKLNSLIFVKNICEGRIRRIQEGGIEDIEEPPDICRAKNIFVLSLDEIIENNIALAVFIEFMTNVCGQQYLFFYLNVEGFRTAAGQQVMAAHQRAMNGVSTEADLESLRRAAMIIYDQYLSDKGTSKIKIDNDITRRTLQKIKNKNISEDLFDEAQSKVYQILHSEQYYEAFLQSHVYLKMLQEMGLSKPDKPDDGDTSSLDEVPQIIWFKMDDSAEESSLPRSRSDSPVTMETVITAFISQTGIMKESDKNSAKTYAVFAIRATKTSGDEEDVSETYRRYSDFHDLHMLIQEKYPEFQGPPLPGKTVLKNMNKDFLEKRKKSLDTYLQTLMKPEIWAKYPGMKELVLKFVAPGLWEKHKSELARKMDTLVNPIKTSVKSVGRAVSQDSLIFKGDSMDRRSGKVSDGLDVDADNIPLRVMLLLMDEVFDLREKNTWLRRRIVAVLKQLIKVTFGDSINKKIVDYVEFLTSAEQMAEYVRKFRDAFWPGGSLAEPRAPRDHHTKMRTRVLCRAKMLGSVSDDFRHLMGTETIRVGTSRMFDMFQHQTLNKRFVYVFLEGVIITLFPQNKFSELFQRLHSRSERVTKHLVKENSDNSELSGPRKRR